MKKSVILLVIFILLSQFSTYTFAQEDMTIREENQYKGVEAAEAFWNSHTFISSKGETVTNFPNTYGGMYFDDNGDLTFALTKLDKSTIQYYKLHTNNYGFKTKKVQFSYNELEASKKKVLSSQSILKEKGFNLSSISIIQGKNKVEVSVIPITSLTTSQRNSIMSTDFVNRSMQIDFAKDEESVMDIFDNEVFDYKIVYSPIKQEYNPGQPSYFLGSSNAMTGTIGFYGYTNGQLKAVTAGHNLLYRYTAYSDLSCLNEIGSKESVFIGHYVDAGTLRPTGYISKSMQMLYDKNTGSKYAVKGTYTPFEGMACYVFGGVSGMKLSVVNTTGKTVLLDNEYGSTQHFIGFIGTNNYVTSPGDSGGAWAIKVPGGVKIVGIHAGGSGGEGSYFSGINSVMSQLNIQSVATQ